MKDMFLKESKARAKYSMNIRENKEIMDDFYEETEK